MKKTNTSIDTIFDIILAEICITVLELSANNILFFQKGAKKYVIY